MRVDQADPLGGELVVFDEMQDFALAGPRMPAEASEAASETRSCWPTCRTTSSPTISGWLATLASRRSVPSR